jgi:hypothetical protein
LTVVLSRRLLRAGFEGVELQRKGGQRQFEIVQLLGALVSAHRTAHSKNRGAVDGEASTAPVVQWISGR